MAIVKQNACIIIACWIFAAAVLVQGNTYEEKNKKSERPKLVTSATGFADWKACMTACQADPTCIAFLFKMNQCDQYQHPLGYGPLNVADGMITGQLESHDANATLAWAGIGAFEPSWIRPMFSGIPWPINDAQMQAACDAHLTDYGVECASYWHSNNDVNSGEVYVNAFLDLDEFKIAYIGRRTDLNMSRIAIIGDFLETRTAAADFPPEPPDIGTGVPDYTEMEFHWHNGFQFDPMVMVDAASQFNCSVVCHRTVGCNAFFFATTLTTNNCRLFDTYVLGTSFTRGTDQYGIIDRDGGEGATKYVVDNVGPAGSALKLLMDIPLQIGQTVADCARHCYRFAQPQPCISFNLVFNVSSAFPPTCTLFAGLPCGNEKRQSTLNHSSHWHLQNYRYGYINARVSAADVAEIETCKLPKPPTARRIGDVQIFSENSGKIVTGVTSVKKFIKASSLQCSLECHMHIWCVSLDWDEITGECRLFAAKMNGDELANNATTDYVVSDVVYYGGGED